MQKAPAKPKKTKEPKEDKPKDEEKKEEVPAENGETKADDEVSLWVCDVWSHWSSSKTTKKKPNAIIARFVSQAPASEESEKNDDAAE